MNIVVDTNILVCFLTNDDARQSQVARRVFSEAEYIIIPTHVFCELTWVLLNAYQLSVHDVSNSIRNILRAQKVIVKNDEIEAGLKLMDNGGDFADGVNEYTGRMMTQGSCVFVSFDKKAVRLLNQQGFSAMIPE
jgi:predicted nucleic-acid-binding protein